MFCRLCLFHRQFLVILFWAWWTGFVVIKLCLFLHLLELIIQCICDQVIFLWSIGKCWQLTCSEKTVYQIYKWGVIIFTLLLIETRLEKCRCGKGDNNLITFLCMWDLRYCSWTACIWNSSESQDVSACLCKIITILYNVVSWGKKGFKEVENKKL